MISLRGPKLKIFASILAVICLAAGVYITFFHSQGFLKNTATIVDLELNVGTDGDPDTYTPIVEHTVDGVVYTGRLDESSAKYREGQTISILYDPNDPTVVHGTGPIGIALMVVSAAILAVIVIATVREKQSQNQAKELRESRGQTGYAPSEQGEERELYFLTDLGTPKYGHRMEDRNRRVLYEAKMTKFSLASAHEFDFIDYEHGTTTPHLVGHEEESQWNSFLIDNHYTFELDGVDVWKHLKQNGISADTNFTVGEATAVGKNYRILRDGQEIARAQQTSQYVHEEDAEAHKVVSAIPAQGFYRVWTREKNLDALFMTLVAFARTGASDSNGGNFGAVMGTIKNIGK